MRLETDAVEMTMNGAMIIAGAIVSNNPTGLSVAYVAEISFDIASLICDKAITRKRALYSLNQQANKDRPVSSNANG